MIRAAFAARITRRTGRCYLHQRSRQVSAQSLTKIVNFAAHHDVGGALARKAAIGFSLIQA